MFAQRQQREMSGEPTPAIELREPRSGIGTGCCRCGRAISHNKQQCRSCATADAAIDSKGVRA